MKTDCPAQRAVKSGLPEKLPLGSTWQERMERNMRTEEIFLHLVGFGTQSDESSESTPSTPGQLVLANELVRMMKEMGCSRIVTAREMSLEEIRRIHDETDIEI